MLVKINNEFSESMFLTHSVLQGTVLEPLLLIIYINGLLNLNIKGKIICYADDTLVLLKKKIVII